MVTMKAPKDHCSASVAGHFYDVVEGFIEAKIEHVAELLDIGFAIGSADDDNDPNFEPTEDFDTMKRGELFAWLKAKGIAVSVPIDNETLRAIARENAGVASPVIPAAPAVTEAPIEPETPVEPAPVGSGEGDQAATLAEADPAEPLPTVADAPEAATEAPEAVTEPDAAATATE